jgi:hypothetical protein
MTRTTTRPAALAAAVIGLLLAPAAHAQDLEPPPPMAPGTPSSPSNDADEKKDSGLGLEWVWLNADVGAAYVNMTSFSSSTLALDRSSSSGPAFGLGAGVRLLFFTAGVRVTDLQLSAFNLWEVSGEAAFHLRIWHIDPYFGVRGGYAFVGSLNSDSVNVATGGSPSNVDVHGFDIGPMFGIDFYLSNHVSLGVDGDAQFLFIQRPPAPIPDYSQLPPAAQQMATAAANSNPLYKESGSSVGLGLTLTAHLGIHF